MDSIRIKNLHCLADTGEVPLKAINILVGANSSGKSSFLRTFPLLKQGLNTNKKGPILWLSEDVDFGDFVTAVRKDQNFIEFEFKIDSVIIKFSIINFSLSSYINVIEFLFSDQIIKIEINSKAEVEQITINGDQISKSLYKLFAIDNRTGILPILRDQKTEINENMNLFSNIQSTLSKTKLEESLQGDIKKIMKTSKISEKTVNTIKRQILRYVPIISNRQEILELYKGISKLQSWQKNVANWNIETRDFKDLENKALLYHITFINNFFNHQISSVFENLSYIAPLRASAERYYRRQNLSLDKVDSKGYNLSMFINNLNKKDEQSLKDWMKKNFDFYINADYDGGHISLSIFNDSTGDKFNLADNGFGFSQVIPIIVVLWSIIENDSSLKNYRASRNGREYKKRIIFFLIEQPELHLHPNFQAKLTDVFISAINIAKQNNIDLKLILETHSETIINRLGKRIYEGKIGADDTTIALFQNKVDPETQKNVQLAKFNKEGVLENWPLGFFDS